MPNEFKVKNGLLVSGSANINASGSGVFSVDGTSGRLFQIDDSLSGSLFSVNTAAGLPIIEAFSDNTVRIGQFGQKALFVSQSRVGIGLENPTANLHVSGTTGGVFEVDGAAAINALYISASGNVGIGTTLPAYKLDVSGSGNFTNGLTVTGSLTVITGSNIEFQVLNTGVRIGNLITDIHTVTGSLNVSGSITGSLFGTASFATTASFAISSSRAVTSSFAISASWAPNTGGGSITVGDESTTQGTATYFNFLGAGVTAAVSSNTASITIPGGGGGGTSAKAGSGSAALFTGTPRTSAITFESAFSDNLYAVTVTGEDARSFTIESKSSTGFTINSNSSVALTGPVYWIATAFN
jgi:hypothetical protein